MLSSTEYLPYLIKDYEYWGLFLNKKQVPYLGRTYAWWKDRTPGEGEGMRPSDLPQEALRELHHTIFDDMLDVCHALGHMTDPYGPLFRLNMACLANEPVHNHHMHWHFVPRFKHPLYFEPLSRRFEDTEFFAHYAKPPAGERIMPEAALQTVRRTMAGAVGGIMQP